MRKVWVVLDWWERESCTVVAIKLTEESAKTFAEQNEHYEVQEFDWVDAYPRRRRSVYGVLKPRENDVRLKAKSRCAF